MAEIPIIKTTVKELFRNPGNYVDKEVRISGWVKSIRDSKNFGFIELNDGSSFKNLQIIFDDSQENFKEITKASIGSSLDIYGKFIESPGSGQSYELKSSKIILVGYAALDNPIQKKRHTLEFLRTIPHLRLRTNTFMATFRVRSLTAAAIHNFFQSNDFVYVHTPIISTNDCEGAGEMFYVTTFDQNNPPKVDGKIDYSQELLGRQTFLTVSGQLAVEPFCMGFRNVYTFGPTFRAEYSNTPRHANEFWMIEPEMAFADLYDDMDLAEAMLKSIIKEVTEKAPEEIQFFNQFVDIELISRLENIMKSDFERITYTEAINILQKSGQKFDYQPKWGDDLQTEHERFITEQTFKKPVFVTDYPKDIKAFYMKLNSDGKTVRAMDLLVPGVGEIVGGSQREENLDILMNKFKEHKIDTKEYQAYIDTRKFGTFPHAGFGLGFERAVMYLTGMKNIRDVIPYPRTPNNALS